MAEFKFYYPHKTDEIYLIGKFNNWGKNKTKLQEYKFDSSNYPIYSLNIELEHKTPYLFKVKGENVLDPRAIYFNEDLECVYWDFKKGYRPKYDQLNLKDKSNIILQTDLPGLIKWFRADKGNFKGKLGNEIKEEEYFEFIKTSGIIDKIKDLGFNLVQFLPLTKPIDGGNWKSYYLSAYPYSINDNWGDPDDFIKMIDAFHEENIGIIHDAIYSHVPYKNFAMNGNFDFICRLPNYFMGDSTIWGTKRYKYADEHVRDFLCESAEHFIRDYKIDGFRIDNVDGILRRGDNGDGEEREGGREFLRQLSKTIYSLNKNTIINYEAHYFGYGNAKFLIGNIDEDKKNLGATAYSSSRETYFFQTEYMLKSAPQIKASRIKEIIEEKEWGKSNAVVADFHNHDAAAGLMEGRATGSYAYDAMINHNHHLHYHTIGKIKVMESIISLCLEGRSLNLLQSFLIQTGTFEHDTSIHWYLEMIEANKALLNFKKRINEIMSLKAFSPKEVDKRRIINIDEDNKTITFQKSDYLIFINMSGDMIGEYEIPLKQWNNDDGLSHNKFKLIFNSDEFQYCGSGRTLYPSIFEIEKIDKLKIGWVAGYGILVLKML